MEGKENLYSHILWKGRRRFITVSSEIHEVNLFLLKTKAFKLKVNQCTLPCAREYINKNTTKTELIISYKSTVIKITQKYHAETMVL